MINSFCRIAITRVVEPNSFIWANEDLLILMVHSYLQLDLPLVHFYVFGVDVFAVITFKITTCHGAFISVAELRV